MAADSPRKPATPSAADPKKPATDPNAPAVGPTALEAATISTESKVVPPIDAPTRDNLTPDQHAALAKIRLLESARAIRPLDPLRRHPWTTVGIAGGAGAVLGGITGGRGGGGVGGLLTGVSAVIGSLASVLRSLSGMAGPLASIVGPLVAGKVASESTKHDAADAVSAANAGVDPHDAV